MTIDATSTNASATIARPRAGADVALRFVADKAEWDRLVAAAPMPHLPQDFAYGAGKAATGWTVTRAVFELDGRAIAFATVLQLRRFGLTLVNRINRGPVFFGQPSDEQIVAVYRAIRNRWGRVWTAPLSIAPALPTGADSETLLRRAGYVRRQRLSWQSGRIDLAVGEDALWARMASGFRNRLRNADKAGAQLRIADDAATFDWLMERHVENMAAKGFDAASPALLRAMRAAAPENVTVFQLIHDGAPVAGMSVARFGTHAEYHIGWFGPEGRKLNAGNFLMWNVMRELQRRGVATFDVGGLKPGDGYTQFKRTMKPDEYALVGEWISF
ncbi:MAG: lipid II:glycine glycyltransferase FemX [Devosia sp.]